MKFVVLKSVPSVLLFLALPLSLAAQAGLPTRIDDPVASAATILNQVIWPRET
jgi:hypothetical protein